MQKRLRIISSVDPRDGGPIEGIRQQAAYHAAAGIEEHVVSLDPPDAPWVRDFPLTLFACGEFLANVNGWRRRLPWRQYGYQPAFLPWLKAHIRNYDLVIVHGLWNYSTMAARLALVGSGVPYVVFSHGMLDPWFKRNFPLKAAAKQIFWWFNEGPLLNNARFVLFTSEDERLLARGSFRPYRVNERVVAYGTSGPSDIVDAQISAFRAHIPHVVQPYLLYLSRIHPKKGCDLLIDAFADVCGPRGDIDLVIAGPAAPELQRRLKAQAAARGVATRIHWPGMLCGEAKWGAFRSAEAFVLPSHQENFGIVVAEAMACGKPVLITYKVNIWREVIECGGGLVDSDDLQGIKRLLRKFIALSPEERAGVGRRARAGFLDLYAVSKAVETINDACRDAMSGISGDPTNQS